MKKDREIDLQINGLGMTNCSQMPITKIPWLLLVLIRKVGRQVGVTAEYMRRKTLQTWLTKKKQRTLAAGTEALQLVVQ